MSELNINDYYLKLKRQSVLVCIFIFLIFLIMFTSQIFLQVLNSNSDSLINIAGRQRMLSQKLALHKITDNKKLSETLQTFTKSQNYLDVETKGEIKKYYTQVVSADFLAYVMTLRSDHVSLNTINQKSENILKKLDHGVQLLERRSNKNELYILYLNVFFIVLMIVALLILYFNILKKHRLEIINNLKSYANEKMKANESTRAKSQFLANMSHELRTPLNGIIGIGELLKDTDLSRQQQNYLKTLVSASVGLKDIINQILDFSKLEMSNVAIVKKKFSLVKLVDEVQSILHPKVSSKGLFIKSEKDKSIPEYVVSDPLRIKQVLLNIVNNAIKFTEGGGVTIKLFSDDTGVTFEVIDTGIGIAPDNLKLIFEDFTQVENTYIKSQEGTGLGLAISKKIVEALGGSISVTSELGRGASFTFTLPVEIEKESISPLMIEDLETVELSSHVGKVLVAEDNKINQIVIKGLLSRLKIDFDFANNGQEAVEMFKLNNYDLVLMDISMPILDGFEAAAKIRTFDEKVPIFCISANVFEDDQKKAMDAGMNEFLEKPISRNRLTECLNKYFS